MIDNDKPALAVSPMAMDVDEGDAAGEIFNVRLATAPSSEVTVAISGHSGTDVTPSRTSLRFTTNNWETDQSVRVTAGEDGNAVDEEVRLGLAASGGGYGSVFGRGRGNGDRQRQAGAGGKSDGDGR